MNTSNRSSAINRRHWIAAAVLTALICGTSFGEEAGSDAAVVAFEAALSKAEDGDPDAMVSLGFMYADGKGVIEDDKESAKWWRKAAELGNAKAMVFLGVMYAYGKGVIEDDKEAVKWYRKAAELGDADAMFNLCVRYYLGEGVSQDYKQAVKWYSKAAELGHKASIVSRTGGWPRRISHCKI